MRYTDDALEAAAKLAARHLRDYRLPDSAIDVLDEAGAKARLTRGSPVPGRRRRRRQPPATREWTRRRRRSSLRLRSRRRWRSRPTSRVVARMARIPAKQASSDGPRPARAASRNRSDASCSGRRRPSALVARAIKRSRAGLGQPDRPAGVFPLHRSDRRRQDRARRSSSRCISATSSSATT